jgi:uncharacterized protein (DUF885 family)
MRLLPSIAAALGAIWLASACGSGGAGNADTAGTPLAPPVSKEERDSPARPVKPSRGLADQAAAGVKDAGLAELLRQHWEWTMERDPVWATTLGDHRFDDRLSDNSAVAIAAERARVRDFLARARRLPADSLAPGDRVTLALFASELEARVDTEVCETHLWNVTARANPVAELSALPAKHVVKTPADGRNLVARYRQIARSVDNSMSHLRAGAQRGLHPGAESVRRAIAMVDGQLAEPTEKWVHYGPARAPRPGWSAGERSRLAGELRQVVEQDVRPAFERYRKLLSEEVLPRARGPKKVGVGHLRRGIACYKARAAEHTGLDLGPAELHKLGQEQIARINREMLTLGRSLFGKAGSTLPAIIEKLRKDPELYFRDADEIVRAAETALAAARNRMPDFFGRVPRANCVVVPMPAFEAPYAAVADYREPHADGSKPGEYRINTHKPEVRPRFEMQALTFHESIPGHHLQIALGQEQPALPAFRRFFGSTAFVEGWALYTERLADEMKLYTNDLDRMGMLSFDAWRASRLVVDTGIHTMGWTREQAEAYMREHTALTEENIRNEVDRYIGWPGQALAYKVGQLEIVRLRAEAEKALGSRFDLRRFHDVVLGSGAVTLPVLADQVASWIEAEKKR